MKNSITIFTSFLFSTIYVLLLDQLSASRRTLEIVSVLLIVVLLFPLYLSKLTRKTLFNNRGSWLFLFWGTVTVQVLVLATGGLHSPFLILIHLLMIGLSFVFSFPIGLSFLGVSCLILILDVILHNNIITYFLDDPGTILLQLISLISIIPVAYLVAQKYHMRDWILSQLQEKVVTDEAILEKLHELIIVTDANLNILSVNDAVPRTLLRSRSEFLHRPIFDQLLLKDNKGKLVTKETFFPNGDVFSPPESPKAAYTIFRTSSPQRIVTIQVQIIKNLETNRNQICFVLRYPQELRSRESNITVTVEKARAKYEALSEDIKKELFKKGSYDLQNQVILLEKVESDIYTVQLLKEGLIEKSTSRIDVAKLTERVVMLEHDFAKALRVSITFSIDDFGMKDVSPLLANDTPVDVNQFTGPFFTVSCDVKLIELLLKKLLDMCIMLGSTEKDPALHVSIRRGEKETISITVRTNCPTRIQQKDLQELLLPYYGRLYDKTNVSLGSGLEGFIVQKITDLLSLSLEMQLRTEPVSQVTFTLTLPKDSSMQKQ